MSISTLVFVSMLVVIGINAEEEEEEEVYHDEFGHVDLKLVVDNDRLFKKFADCITDDKAEACPGEAVHLRNILPEMLETVCEKCPPEKIEKAMEAGAYICTKKPDDFLKYLEKVDPTGEIRERFEEKFGIIPECDSIRV